MHGFDGVDRMYHLAATLLSDSSGENPEYDRALTELVMLSEGLGSESLEDIAAALVKYADPELTPQQKRLESLRVLVRVENMSWSEIHELQGLAEHIDPSDTEMLAAAGFAERVV